MYRKIKNREELLHRPEVTEQKNTAQPDYGLSDPADVHGLTDAVSRHTGLNFMEKDIHLVHKVLNERMKTNRVSCVSEYVQLLEGNTAAAKKECAYLIVRMTVGESYFFRDRGQLALLRDVILPECIKRNEQSKKLRLLSAGCSSGEEPYTIAMLLDEIIPAANSWNITIIGVDINDESLERARGGIYTDWSMRMMDDERKKKYFTHGREGWKLHENIKKMVRFYSINLVDLHFITANQEINNLDLVLCRNVFIYLNKEAVSRILSQLTGALSEGGCMVTGHGELYACKTEHLVIQSYPDSVVYRKAANAAREVVAAGESVKKKGGSDRAFNPGTVQPTRGDPPGTGVKKNGTISRRETPIFRDEIESDLTKLFLSGKYDTVIQKSRELIENGRSIPWAYSLIARSYANLGDKVSAAGTCNKIIENDSTAPEPYFLLAQIHEGNGDTRGAIDLLKKVIYLTPDFPAAYVELAALYDGENDRKTADRMYQNALELLEGMPAGDSIEFYEGMTAGELLNYIRNGIGQAVERGGVHGE